MPIAVFPDAAQAIDEILAAAPVPPVEGSNGVDFGFDDRSVRVSQEAYSIFIARKSAGKAQITALQQRLNIADQRADDLQSELTKAYRIFRAMIADCGLGLHWTNRINELLANRSAPAAKDGE